MGRIGPGRRGFTVTQPSPHGGLAEDHLDARAASEHQTSLNAGLAVCGFQANDHASRLQAGDAAVRWDVPVSDRPDRLDRAGAMARP
jgi:hypothetical protein